MLLFATKRVKQNFLKYSAVQAGSAISDNSLYFFNSTNFENIKKTKNTVFLEIEIYIDFRIRQ